VRRVAPRLVKSLTCAHHSLTLAAYTACVSYFSDLQVYEMEEAGRCRSEGMSEYEARREAAWAARGKVETDAGKELTEAEAKAMGLITRGK
jgi:hypothetical protein